jgi:hypothetical protein
MESQEEINQKIEGLNQLIRTKVEAANRETKALSTPASPKEEEKVSTPTSPNEENYDKLTISIEKADMLDMMNDMNYNESAWELKVKLWKKMIDKDYRIDSNTLEKMKNYKSKCKAFNDILTYYYEKYPPVKGGTKSRKIKSQKRTSKKNKQKQKNKTSKNKTSNKKGQKSRFKF